ncbi:MAG: hypothetical protein KDB66_11345 [Solirubrobacterales bacterium]|nr:hypothetical protein [Solirubrobacterales bacterium]MCB8915996.1 hypothetical protein [Thermoleophilales bacterium]
MIGPKGKGIGFRFSISEQASASADYFKLVRRGKGKHARTVRMFQGYGEWNSHIGFNNVRFGARTPNFRARPGKYLAFFRADDDAHNSTEDIKLRFEIKGKKKQKSRKHHRR